MAFFSVQKKQNCHNSELRKKKNQNSEFISSSSDVFLTEVRIVRDKVANDLFIFYSGGNKKTELRFVNS